MHLWLRDRLLGEPTLPSLQSAAFRRFAGHDIAKRTRAGEPGPTPVVGQCQGTSVQNLQLQPRPPQTHPNKQSKCSQRPSAEREQPDRGALAESTLYDGRTPAKLSATPAALPFYTYLAPCPGSRSQAASPVVVNGRGGVPSDRSLRGNRPIIQERSRRKSEKWR